MKNVGTTKLDLGVASEVEDLDFEEILELEFDFKHVFNNKKIIFKGCIFRKGITFSLDLTHARISELDITFEECVIESNKSNHKIIAPKSLKLNLLFFSCFIRDLKLVKSSFQSVLFSKCILYSRLLVQNSSISVISVRNSLGRVFLIRNKQSKVLISYADDNLYLTKSIIRNVNKLIKTENGLPQIFAYKSRMDISGAREIICDFNKSEKVKNEVVQKQSSGIRFYFNEKRIELLDISLSINTQFDYLKSITINNGFFNSLALKGESDALIDVRNTKAKNVYIADFSSRRFRLYNFSSRQEKSKFEIKNSDLKNSWFDKVQLNKFGIVSIYRTTVQNTKFSATEFPEKIEALENIHYPEKKERDYHKNQYENYKQLTISLSQDKDQIQALQMHSKMYSSIRKSKDLSCQDKLILFLNDISNKHGTSIKNAFFCFLVSVFVVYLSFNLMHPNAPYKIGWISFQDFLKASKATLVFIFNQWENLFVLANPTHRISQLKDSSSGHDLSFGNYFISFFSRILIGWSIYQFITAFRKFGKNI